MPGLPDIYLLFTVHRFVKLNQSTLDINLCLRHLLNIPLLDSNLLFVSCQLNKQVCFEHEVVINFGRKSISFINNSNAYNKQFWYFLSVYIYIYIYTHYGHGGFSSHKNFKILVGLLVVFFPVWCFPLAISFL